MVRLTFCDHFAQVNLIEVLTQKTHPKQWRFSSIVLIDGNCVHVNNERIGDAAISKEL